MDNDTTNKSNTLKNYEEELKSVEALVSKAKLKPNYKYKLKEFFPKALYACNGYVFKACELIGISTVTYYEWYKTDEEFKKVIDEVKDRLIDFLEAQLLYNASIGKETSNIFALKNLRPDKWRDRKEVDFTGRISKGELDEDYARSQELVSAAVAGESVEGDL